MISLKDQKVLLPIDGLELLGEEMIYVVGGYNVPVDSPPAGSGSGCGCGCPNGAGCGCGCSC